MEFEDNTKLCLPSELLNDLLLIQKECKKL